MLSELNVLEGKPVGAYTFEVGTGAFIIRRNTKREGNWLLGGITCARGSGVGRKYATVVPEGYDTRPFEALKDGASSVIFTRVGEGPIRTNDTD